jgi:hypothetical protein
MKVIFAVSILFAAFYFVWWGYKNLVRRESDPNGGPIEGQLCQICRQAYPISELVVREKMAGFENYFCGNCIEALMRDYNEKIGKSSTDKPLST